MKSVKQDLQWAASQEFARHTLSGFLIFVIAAAGVCVAGSGVTPRPRAQNGEILRPESRDFGIGTQNDNQREQDQQIPTIKREVRLVLVEATVKDKNSRVMRVLKKEDVLLYEDGQPQEIVHFSQDQLPLAVAMVVDLSTSIESYLQPLRSASIAALGALKQQDEVALFTFTSYVEKRVDLTHNKRKIADEIRQFNTRAGSNINDGLYEAARYLRKRAPASRRVIVLVSDNIPSVGGAAPSEVLKEALEGDTAIYSLKVPGRSLGFSAVPAKRGFVDVKDMTEETGGEIFEVQQEGSMLLVLQALIERLKSRYTLGYYPASETKDGKLRKLEVKLRPSFGQKGHDYTVLSRKGYYPAAK
jgi:Ca-activated chloride channel family protein